MAITNVTGDAMEKRHPLDEEEVDAQDKLGKELHDVWWHGNGGCHGYMVLGLLGFVHGVTFRVGNVGAVDDPGTADVIRRDFAVQNIPMIDAMFEQRVGRATKDVGEFPGGIRSLDLASSEEGFLASYGLEEGVGGNGASSMRCYRGRWRGREACADVQAIVEFTKCVDRAVVGAVDKHRTFNGCVHGNPAEGGNISKGEHVAKGAWIVPHRNGHAREHKITDFICDKRTTLGVQNEVSRGTTDVGDVGCIFEETVRCEGVKEEVLRRERQIRAGCVELMARDLLTMVSRPRWSAGGNVGAGAVDFLMRLETPVGGKEVGRP